MDDFKLLIDLHKDTHRQGPGGDAETELALNIAMADRTAPLKIADTGCGTGASTLVPLCVKKDVALTINIFPDT